MTITAPAAPAATTATSNVPARRRFRMSRSTVIIMAAFVLAVVVVAFLGTGDEQYDGRLDPRNPSPEGGQALASVLDDEGVEVDIVRSADALEDTDVDNNTTVLVTGTNSLSPSTLRRLREHAAPGRLVLIDLYRLADEIDPDLGITETGAVDATANCFAEGDEAALSGIDLSGLSLEVDEATTYSPSDDSGAVTCFGDGYSVLAELPAQDLVLFGGGAGLANNQVLRGDNAAIGLRLAGANDRLIWYVPDRADAEADEAVGLGSLLPRWIGPGIWIAAIAAIGLIAWRVRRLGALATEPLPVVVRAVETTRSRGRMYRKGSDRAHAAAQLRRAARNDLIRRLRLDPRADAVTIANATANEVEATSEAIAQLLTDNQPAPASDRELVALAHQLTRLRKEVRRG